VKCWWRRGIGVAARFATLPATEAGIRSSLASAFGVIDQHEDARVEAERALALLAASEQHDTAAEFATRVVLIRALGRLGRFDDAASALAEFEQRAGTAPAASTRQQLAMARAGLHMVRSEFDQAVIALRAAIDGIDPDDPGAVAQRDSLRLDQIIALTFAGQDAQAIEQGRGLIDEASTRAENSELLIALTRLALARAQGEDHAAAQALLMQGQAGDRGHAGREPLAHARAHQRTVRRQLPPRRLAAGARVRAAGA
jgi:tetratricopeptide (TPR) repeat protein